jgi:hypothetical protein
LFSLNVERLSGASTAVTLPVEAHVCLELVGQPAFTVSITKFSPNSSLKQLVTAHPAETLYYQGHAWSC